MTTSKKYQVFHPDHQTLIGFLLGVKNAINSENFTELFEKAGFLDKTPDDWVHLQTYLDIVNQLEERDGAMLNFVSIGLRSAMDIEFSPEFIELSLEEKLHTVTQIYAQLHRGTDVGYAKTRVIAPGHLVYITRSPFPDDLAYGNIYGIAKRFLPANMAFKVYYDKETPRREEGGEETIVHIEWWEKDSK